MFSGDLYTKGAIIVKLIKDLVGPIEFRSGVSRYKFYFLKLNNKLT